MLERLEINITIQARAQYLWWLLDGYGMFYLIIGSLGILQIQIQIIITVKQQSMIQVGQPLKQLFGDANYAWELLECQVKIQTSHSVTGEDISHLLQLYMRGVEKMNSLLDIREAFFRSRLTTLMSKQNVVKSFNRPMSKKSQSPIVQSSPVKKIEAITMQLQLKQKKKQLQMRVKYGEQQHNQKTMKSLMKQQQKKQTMLTDKIINIVDSHQERLMNRIRQRKLRTMTAKSRSDIYMNNDTNDTNGADIQDKKELMERRRDEQQFGTNQANHTPIKKSRPLLRKIKSMSPKRSKIQFECDSPLKRRVSVDLVDKKKTGKQLEKQLNQ